MNYELLCIHACEIVENCAKFITHEWNRLQQINVEIKGEHNFVTYIDKQSEEQLVDGLFKLLPQSTFLTEEMTVEQQQGEFLWIIDPLDGTTNYIHKLSPVAISVALYQNNEPVLGIIYEIGLKRMFLYMERRLCISK